MNIAQVIGWKFNNRPGMVCRGIKGVIRIVEFPGGIPTEQDQETWTNEYRDFIASGGLVDQQSVELVDQDKIARLTFEVCFDLERRMRVLEDRPTITKLQYRMALLTILKGLP